MNLKIWQYNLSKNKTGVKLSKITDFQGLVLIYQNVFHTCNWDAREKAMSVKNIFKNCDMKMPKYAINPHIQEIQ
jgi:hypothetical protein